MSLKKPLNMTVLEAARSRISLVFDRFERVYLSFSGGKDSSVMLDLVAREARSRGRVFGLLLIDLEAQYQHTINHALSCFNRYSDCIEPYWISLPLSLRNAVSQFAPQWTAFDPGLQDEWVRQPPDIAITDPDHFDFFRPGMEFEEFIVHFGKWFGQEKTTACFVGIRSDESLNRFRTLTKDKRMLDRYRWTTWVADHVYNAYPIYDWKTSDVWKYSYAYDAPVNPIYELMQQAGVPLGHQRICQPYGDDQRKGLWLYHILEPESWPRILNRVAGVNGGALYSRTTGNILGNTKVTLPEGHTWQSYTEFLLSTMPEKTANHYRGKIQIFLSWWAKEGYPNGIPDEADPKLESAKKMPSWRRIARVLLRNDYWCKGLSFSQTKSPSYENYRRIKALRKKRWRQAK